MDADYCKICGRELNLALSHSYNRELQAMTCNKCEKEITKENNNEHTKTIYRRINGQCNP
jgi:hypothetical protein